jgi:hypothetical protein
MCPRRALIERARQACYCLADLRTLSTVHSAHLWNAAYRPTAREMSCVRSGESKDILRATSVSTALGV